MVRKPNSTSLHTVSKYGGGILLGLGAFGLIWFVFLQHIVMPASPQWTFTLANTTPTSVPVVQTSALQDAGITLTPTSQPALVSQEQAAQLANQQQPEAAASAKKIEIRYGLLNDPSYQGSQNLKNQPVWMIWYQNIPKQSNDVEGSVQPAYDYYVFIDAKTGQTVLTIWV
jgi:hypothetical protein